MCTGSIQARWVLLDRNFVEAHNHIKNAAALVSLARTCHALHEIATPALYRYPYRREGDLLTLVRNVLKNPKNPTLGHYIHHLIFEDWFLQEVLTDDDLSLFQRVVAKYHVADLSPNWHLAHDPTTRIWHGKRLEQRREAVLAGLLIAHCPDLQELGVTLSYLISFPFCKPGTLPRLHHLELTAKPKAAPVSYVLTTLLPPPPIYGRFGAT